MLGAPVQQGDNRVQDSLLSYPAVAGPGYEPGPPGWLRALYHVVLRAFAPPNLKEHSEERGSVSRSKPLHFIAHL